MKIYLQLPLLILLGVTLSACQNESRNPIPSEPLTPPTQTQSPAAQAAGEHYVRVVVPEDEKSQGAKVTLNMPPQEPYVFEFPDTIDLTMPDERVHVISVDGPLQPATMTVDYSNGDSHTMSQVIFDATIETP